jgi:ABC-2 type transport system permease protein
MGLMSREVSSGSIKLLFSAPVKLWEIILGKYVAMMAYGLLLIAILELFVIANMFSISHIDLSLVLSALLGLYLLMAAYIAIGLFISCLTSYQVVAAIGTIAVFSSLNYMSNLWQDFAVFREIAYFLKMSAHMDKFFKGLVTSRDVLYFLLIIFLFLTLSVFKLLYTRQKTSFWKQTINYSLLISAVLFTGYLTANPYLQLSSDWTATKQNTISPESQEILKKMSGPLKITAYGNMLTDHWWTIQPKNGNANRDFWTPFTRFKPDIELKYQLYYNHNIPDGTERMSALKTANAYSLDRSLVLSPDSIGKMINLKGEEDRFIRQLEFGNKKVILRIFNEPRKEPSEREIMAAVKLLTTDAPKVAVLSGHQERDMDNLKPRGYRVLKEKSFRAALVNQGFDVFSLNLSEQEIPKDLLTLVISNPQVLMSSSDLNKIKNYLNGGGNLLIAGEPGFQEFINPVLNELELGVQLNKGMLIQQIDQGQPQTVFAAVPKSALSLAAGFNNGERVALTGGSTLSFEQNRGFKVYPLAVTDASNTWTTMKDVRVDDEEAKFDPLAGDVKVELPVALALSRKMSNKEQKIIVLADADILSNQLLTANKKFYFKLFSWFSSGQFPFEPSSIDPMDNEILVTKVGVSVIRWLFIGLLPGLILLYGTVLLLIRNRK